MTHKSLQMTVFPLIASVVFYLSKFNSHIHLYKQGHLLSDVIPADYTRTCCNWSPAFHSQPLQSVYTSASTHKAAYVCRDLDSKLGVILEDTRSLAERRVGSTTALGKKGVGQQESRMGVWGVTVRIMEYCSWISLCLKSSCCTQDDLGCKQQHENNYLFKVILMPIFPRRNPVLGFKQALWQFLENVHFFGQKHNCQKENSRMCQWKKKGHGEKRADYKNGKEWQKRERDERTSLPFGVKRGPIDGAVMSLVLAGVQRDRNGAEGGQRGKGRVRIWFPTANNTIAADIRTNTWVHLWKPDDPVLC